MTDFWQRLAARSLGETPRVQPAIAPLYAPGRILAQPLDQAENTQDTASLNHHSKPIPASRLVESLPLTSPFADLTRSPQPIENRTQLDRTSAGIEREQNSVQRDRPAVDREQLTPQRLDLVPQVQPIVQDSIASEPIASEQPSLPLLQPSVQPADSPISHLASLNSPNNIQTNPQINPQIPTSFATSAAPPPASPVRPLPNQSFEARQPAADHTRETSASETSASESSASESSTASSQPIAPLISTAQSQTAQPQTADRQAPASLLPIPLPQITPLIRKAEATEAIAESERRSPQPVALPTIQVTIGRIEIRTTPPAANRSKPSRSAPQLSLQDYLKQQDLKQPVKQPDLNHQRGKR
jgi:hypothetical protein